MSINGKYSNLSKNTILFTINSLGSKLISFLLVPLYTYILSTNDYGTADLITSTALLLTPLVTVNIQDAVLRFALDKNKDRREVLGVGILINVLGVIFLTAVIGTLIGFNILKIQVYYAVALITLVAVNGAYNSVQLYIRAIDKVNVFVISGITSTLISCISNILLLVVFKLGVIGYLISNIVGHFSAIIIMFVGGKLYNEAKFNFNKQLTKEMLIFSLPLVVNSVSWWINQSSDKYILVFFCGAAITGIYSVAYKIPTILSTVQAIFYNAWSVSAITEFDKNDGDGFIGNIYSLYTCLTSLACSIILIMNIFLSRLLYNNDFFEAWKCVPLLLLGAFFNGITLVEGCLFTAIKKTKEVTRTTIIGAVINITINFVCIPFWKAEGAAFATMIGYFSSWLAITISVGKIISMKVDWKKHIVVILLLTIQTFIAMFSAYYFTFIQIVIFIILALIQFKYVLKVLNKIKLKYRK